MDTIIIILCVILSLAFVAVAASMTTHIVHENRRTKAFEQQIRQSITEEDIRDLEGAENLTVSEINEILPRFASEPTPPWSVLAITFTNKAAKEILERVANITNNAYKMWIGTFHSICVKILRKFGHFMGISYFSIIDEKESKNILKQICLDLGKELPQQSIKDIKSKISTYKSNLIKPERVLSDYCTNNLEDTFVASLPSTALFRYDFASPIWTPTLSGFVMIICLLLSVVIFIRFLIWLVLRLSLLFI